jgi:hypothetical protein
MATTEKQIEKLTKDYTTALTALIREQVLEEKKDEMVAFFLNGSSPKKTKKRRTGAKKAVAKKNGKKALGAKRSPKALEKLQERVLSTIQNNPGIYSEDIAQTLRVKNSRDISLPLKKLREAKLIRKRGNRRETQYYPQSKAKRK